MDRAAPECAGSRRNRTFRSRIEGLFVGPNGLIGACMACRIQRFGVVVRTSVVGTLAALLGALQAAQAQSVQLDNGASNGGSGGYIAIPGFTIANQPDRALIVVAGGALVDEVTAVLWNGTESLTKLGEIDDPGLDNYLSIWGLMNPTATTADIEVGFNGWGNEVGVIAASFYNVDQTSPLAGSVVSDWEGQGGGTSMSIAPSGVDGGVVVGAGWRDNLGGAQTVTDSAAGMVRIAEELDVEGFLSFALSYRAADAAAPFTLGWDFTGGTTYSILGLGVGLRPAGGGNSPPNAEDNSYTIAAGSGTSLLDVLDNDDDPDEDPLTITSVTFVSGNGSAEPSGDNLYVAYTPGAAGTDTFTYTIDDGNGGIDTATVTVTVTATSVAFSVNDISATEGGSLVFTVTKTGSTSQSHSVDYATANGTATAGSDYTAKSGTLTFTSSETTKTVTVATTNDTIYEASETALLNLSSATNGATISDSQGVGTINDNDPAPAFSVSDVSAAEGGSLSFTVTKTGSTSMSHNVSYATANGTATAGSDYTAKSGTLTFTSGQTTHTVTVTTLTDATYDPNETVLLNLSSATNGATISDSQGVGTIEDDDSQNQPPTAEPDDFVRSVGTGPSELDVLDNDTDPEDDPLTILDVSSVTGSGSVDVASGGDVLTYTPGPEGTASFTYTVSDGEDTDTGSVTVTVEGPKTAAYTYDALGRLRQVVYEDGADVDYNYDAAGNRTTVVATTGGQ